jgi:acyl-CoA reductase-like NAD-dependent aldehyde dehydrogenase
MALMDEAVWRGKIYSGGWVDGGGGDAAVTEPATGAELGRTGIATRADVARAAQIAAAAQPAGARFGGTANLEAFTDTRWVTIRGDIAPYPF